MPSAKTETATATVTPDELERIDKAAAEEDRTRSYWVRRAILRELARQEKRRESA